MSLSVKYLWPLGNRNHEDPIGFVCALPQDFPNHQIAVCSSPFGPGNLNGSRIFLLHPMLCGLRFCLLFPFYSLRGPLNWDNSGARAVSQGMSLAAFPLRGQASWELSGVETSAWQHILCFSITCCVFHPRLTSGGLWILFGQTSFWQFENLVGFQSFPFIFRACPHCRFVCQACTFSWFSSPPALWSMDTVIRIGNLETFIKGPTALL